MWNRAIKWWRGVKELASQLLHGHASPDEIAAGVALGAFIGIVPTFGLGGFIALGIASRLGWNRLAAFLGTFIMNPLTFPFFTALSGLLGAVLLPRRTQELLSRLEDLPNDLSLVRAFFQNEGWGRDLIGAMGLYMVGNLIVALTFAGISFILTKRIIIFHRRRKERRSEMEKAK